MAEVQPFPTLASLTQRLQEVEDRLHESPALQTGDGGGTSGGMNERVTRIEEWAKQADARMGRVEDKLDRILDRLGGLPTKGDMRNYLLMAIGIFVSIVALVFTGMSLMQSSAAPTPAAAPAPVIIQVPPYPAPPAPK